VRKHLRGSVHGRFQPFHKGHLEYFLAAFQQCDFVWIGITQFDIRQLNKTEGAEHRSMSSNNPFSYWQRITMITGALNEVGIGSERFGFVPFPIERPETLPDFFDLSIPIFTTVYDEWNEHKISTLEALGGQVIVLWKRDTKEFEGARIRSLISGGDVRWRELVPSFVARFISNHRLDAAQ
jgi:cytidyltransferase-like protein